MSDVLRRLAERALGVAPSVEPVVAPRFAPTVGDRAWEPPLAPALRPPFDEVGDRSPRSLHSPARVASAPPAEVPPPASGGRPSGVGTAPLGGRELEGVVAPIEASEPPAPAGPGRRPALPAALRAVPEERAETPASPSEEGPLLPAGKPVLQAPRFPEGGPTSPPERSSEDRSGRPRPGTGADGSGRPSPEAGGARPATVEASVGEETPSPAPPVARGPSLLPGFASGSEEVSVPRPPGARAPSADARPPAERRPPTPPDDDLLLPARFRPFVAAGRPEGAEPSPPRAPTAEPPVRVTIGRIEVRAVTPEQPRVERPAAPRWQPPLLGLDDYLSGGAHR